MWLIYKSSKSRSVPLQIHFYGGPCPLNKGEVEVSCKKYYWLVKEETIMALLMKIIFNVSVAATHTVGTTYNHFISAWTIEF